uniref:Uncharacterized protein n=1 Tax=uncultured prokaryote TaxID=198431 RepID=A0A0H5Q8V5_9ZZZZ|nr:hypothetical protein [uncultured prokaryote]
MTALSLHRLGGKLYNKLRGDGLSLKESNLLDQVISELEYRQRVQRVVADKCVCLLCMGPFGEPYHDPELELDDGRALD